MINDICTIPVSEAFEQNDGCPICRMRKTVENRILDYIMGDAMMEPDVRIETNKLGFCGDHLEKMMNRRGRLALALMLQTHTQSLYDELFDTGPFASPAKKAEKARKHLNSCFVCQKIDWGFERMIATIYRTYENDADFRRMFEEQDLFCLNHYALLTAGYDKKQMKRHGTEFVKTIEEKTAAYLQSLHEDLGEYCSMYDYRNAGRKGQWGRFKDSVERTAAFLSNVEDKLR